MKKVIFLINRTNELRYFNSIIETFKKKKISVEIIFLNLSKKKNDYKSYLNPDLIKSDIIKNIKIKKLTNKLDFYQYCIKNLDHISFIFSLVFISSNRFKISNKFLKKISDKWCVIGHGMDSFSQLKDEETYFDYSPKFFFTSKFFYEEGLRYIKRYVKKKNIFNKKNLKIYLVGNTVFNKNIFRNEKHSIKKLVYLPFPFLKSRYGNKDFAFQAAYSGQFINFYSFFRNTQKKNILISLLLQIKNYFLIKLEILIHYRLIKKIYKVNNELSIIKSIRNFCDKNNYKFIVKPRLKFPLIKNIYELADEVIYDDERSQYPSLFQKLLSKSDIIIGSLTSSAYEAAMFKIPFINIEIPKIAFKESSSKFIHKYDKNLYYNYEGVIFNYKIEDFINNFEFEKPQNLMTDKIRSRKYLKKFCGLENNYHDVGNKVFKILEQK